MNIESFKLNKEGGAVIPCLELVPEGASKIVLMVHGFGSQKDCATAQMLFRRMPAAGFGVVTYDQPAHGPDEARSELLTVENCLASLSAVEQAVADRHPGLEIVYFSSSFGAYITTLHICTQAHLGRRAFLRSAAVNMPQKILTMAKEPEIAQLLREQGFYTSDVGPDAIPVPQAFLDGLAANDLTERFAARTDLAARFELVHGELDTTIPLPPVMEFAEHFDLPLTVIPGEEHTLSDFPETPDRAADLAIAFYTK